MARLQEAVNVGVVFLIGRLRKGVHGVVKLPELVIHFLRRIEKGAVPAQGIRAALPGGRFGEQDPGKRRQRAGGVPSGPL